MIENGKLCLTGFHPLLSKIMSLRDDREEPGNCFFSYMTSTFGKATKTTRKTKGVPYFGWAALVQARR
jgi:hypothetical protein